MTSRRPPGKRHIPSAYPKLAPRVPDGRPTEDPAERIARDKARVQHNIPGLNRGPYQTWPPDADLVDQINHVIEHLHGLPCPGCKDAVTLLQGYRAVALMPVIPAEEENAEEDIPDFV